MANRSSNRAAVPEAKGALDKFKYEVASELGVPLSDGYNGDLTSKQNGSVGGYMVKKRKNRCPVNKEKKNRRMAENAVCRFDFYIVNTYKEREKDILLKEEILIEELYNKRSK